MDVKKYFERLGLELPETLAVQYDIPTSVETLTGFTARPLLEPIFINGKQVYKQPSIQESRTYCASQIDSLWDEVKRFENPHNYYVDLSQQLWDIKQALLNSHDM